MKRIFRNMLTALLPLVLFVVPAKGDGATATVAANIEATLVKWQGSDLYNAMEALSNDLNMIRSLAGQESTLKGMYDQLSDLYTKVDDVRRYYNRMRTTLSYLDQIQTTYSNLYYELSLFEQDGWITSSRKQDYLRAAKFMSYDAVRLVKYELSDQGALRSKDLTPDERWNRINENLSIIAGMSAFVDTLESKASKEARQKAAEQARQDVIRSMYSSATQAYIKAARDKGMVTPAVQQLMDARELYAEKIRDVVDSTSLANADAKEASSEDKISSITTSIDGSENDAKARSILASTKSPLFGFIYAVIAFLAVIFAVQAFIKMNKGERQSQDAFFKLFAGTMIIMMVVAVIQAVLFHN